MDSDDLRERMARQEERMNTMNERYDKGWALLREDMAKRDAESARRDKDNLRWVVSLFIAAIVIIPILSNSAAIANLVNLFGS